MLAWLFTAIALLATGCASLPPLGGRTETFALADTAGTRLGRALAPAIAEHRGKTGIHTLSDPHDAFAARVCLPPLPRNRSTRSTSSGTVTKSATCCSRRSGGPPVAECVCACCSTISIRAGLDPVIAALGAHPNIEVRLYNPVVIRGARALNFLTDFTRVNRRMHNKSFNADNQASVVGGRNIGNEYFGAGSGVGFADLDVLAVGSAVPEVSKEFDVYWNSASAYPAPSFVGAPAANPAADLEARFAANRADPECVAYLDAVRATTLVRDLLDRRLDLEWTTAEVVYDDPAKTLDTTERTDVLLFPELVQKMGRVERALDLVSPYFVPGDGGTEQLVTLAQRGVPVRILTNSFAATDEKSVHSGYAKRRRDLLRAGVRLYELKPNAIDETHESRARFGSGSSSGLHAKTLGVERSRIFVGSFNFDQRSALLNTEMGLVIGSPALAEGLAQFFDVEVPVLAYEVRMQPDGSNLVWIERTSSGETRHDTEPGTTWATRLGVDILSIIPIEWLL
jgi:putative cardiolipin synthase